MNDNILIESNDIELAQDICSFIDDSAIRNRAMANVIASKIAKKYFEGYEIDTKSGLHNISKVIEQVDISDIYVNGSYIDVRVYFEENECCIPKFNVKNGITPLAYMFMKLDENINSATVTGFISPESLDNVKSNEEYYIISENDLTSFFDIEPYIGAEDLENLPDDIDKKIHDFSNQDVFIDVEFLKILLHSEQSRTKFIESCRAKQVLSFISVNSEELSSDDDGEEGLNTGSNNLDDNFEQLILDDNGNENDLVMTDITDDSEQLLDMSEQDGVIELSDTIETEELLSNDTQYEPLEEISSSASDDVFELIEDGNVDDSVIPDELDVHTSSELDIISESEVDNDTNQGILEIDDVTAIINADDNPVEQEGLQNENAIAEQSIEYPTETTPSIDAYDTEESIMADNVSEDIISQEDVMSEGISEITYTDNDSIIKEELQNENILTEQSLGEISREPSSDVDITEQDLSYGDNNQDIVEENTQNDSIEELFEKANAMPEIQDKNHTSAPKTSPLMLLGILVVISGLGYFGYTKFFNSASIEQLPNENSYTAETKQVTTDNTDVAMPIETVENEKKIDVKNEGTTVSIPEIERNLGASISISNLRTQWEVSQSYIANTTAKRYFTRIGKVIQLELKAELLLLSKPPITNKIVVEIEFNKNAQKFEVKNITESSGDKDIDDIIKSAISKVLNTKYNVNMDVFNSMQGNPVLIIRL